MEIFQRLEEHNQVQFTHCVVTLLISSWKSTHPFKTHFWIFLNYIVLSAEKLMNPDFNQVGLLFPL